MIPLVIYNALATRSILPNDDAEDLNAKVRRDLGLRLPWLFDKGLLPVSLKALSSCIKEDGNDGAHAGTLKQPDAEDLLDFTTALLERCIQSLNVFVWRKNEETRDEVKASDNLRSMLSGTRVAPLIRKVLSWNAAQPSDAAARFFASADRKRCAARRDS